MRIDKYLKVSRIVKRRAVAKTLCDNKRVLVNDSVVKSGKVVEVGDVITIMFGNKTVSVKILKLVDSTRKEDAASMFELLEEK